MTGPSRFARFIAALLLAPLALANLAPAPARAQEKTNPSSTVLIVKAGPHPRKSTPIRFEVAETQLAPNCRKALESGPVALRIRAEARAKADGVPDAGPSESVAQADRTAEGRVRISWVLPVELARGLERRFLLLNDLIPTTSAWSLIETVPGALELKHRDRNVFRYNTAPVSNPKYQEIQNRDAYIHPAYSPSGALITGDFSTSHPHHRGFFLAYERTRSADLTPDFWNIHVGTGKIHADGLEKPVVGPLTARFSARHRWEARDKSSGKNIVVLRERWDVEAYDIPGSAYWLFDITSNQQAVGRPLDVLPYRYGGMAYRGPEPFVKGELDVLTSEGKHRKDGDQKPARWVDLTGPIVEGSAQYAGAMIADHPANPLSPTVVRIHPTTLPFFSYVPAYDKPLTIGVATPTVFRYRVLVHDGRPDPALDDRVARDFAEPPVVVVE